MGQPLVSVFTEVEGIDDTQGPVCGRQLVKKTHTYSVNRIERNIGYTIDTYNHFRKLNYS